MGKYTHQEATLPTILKIARERKLLPVDFDTSSQSIYRMFKLYGLDKEEGPKKDRRRFEAELPDVDKPHSRLKRFSCLLGKKISIKVQMIYGSQTVCMDLR